MRDRLWRKQLEFSLTLTDLVHLESDPDALKRHGALRTILELGIQEIERLDTEIRTILLLTPSTTVVLPDFWIEYQRGLTSIYK